MRINSCEFSLRRDSMRTAKKVQNSDGAIDPIVELINRLGALNEATHLTIRTSGLSMTIGRNGAVMQ
jgi:hypothetical protein